MIGACVPVLPTTCNSQRSISTPTSIVVPALYCYSDTNIANCDSHTIIFSIGTAPRPSTNFIDRNRIHPSTQITPNWQDDDWETVRRLTTALVTRFVGISAALFLVLTLVALTVLKLTHSLILIHSMIVRLNSVTAVALVIAWNSASCFASALRRFFCCTSQELHHPTVCSQPEQEFLQSFGFLVICCDCLGYRSLFDGFWCQIMMCPDEATASFHAYIVVFSDVDFVIHGEKRKVPFRIGTDDIISEDSVLVLHGIYIASSLSTITLRVTFPSRLYQFPS